MPRVIWKGSISFGLVHVPVGLYSAERREELDLTQLDRRDLSPVGYKRVNKSTGEEVPWDDIVKGYEYEKGQYVVLGEEDFRRANVKATQTVEIVGFVAGNEIPFLYYDRPYYLEPIQRGQKGYVLLRETLRRTGMVGIAKVVLRTRQHLAALRPHEDALVLELLRFQHELRDPNELKIPHESLEALGVSEREVEMAERLVESMIEPWEPSRYRDEYRDDLLRLVDEKIRAGETRALEAPEPEAEPRGAEIIDLMSLLKRSVEQTKKERTPQAPARTPRRQKSKKAPARNGKGQKKRA